MRAAAILSVMLLGAGCSVLYDSSLPPGCTNEDADGDGDAGLAHR